MQHLWALSLERNQTVDTKRPIIYENKQWYRATRPIQIPNFTAKNNSTPLLIMGSQLYKFMPSLKAQLSWTRSKMPKTPRVYCELISWLGPLWWNLSTRVQVLDLARVLALLWIYFRIFRRYALSGKRRSRRQRGANSDFENLQICRSNPSEVP